MPFRHNRAYSSAPYGFHPEKGFYRNKTNSVHLLNEHLVDICAPNKWLVDNENRR